MHCCCGASTQFCKSFPPLNKLTGAPSEIQTDYAYRTCQTKVMRARTTSSLLVYEVNYIVRKFQIQDLFLIRCAYFKWPTLYVGPALVQNSEE